MRTAEFWLKCLELATAEHNRLKQALTEAKSASFCYRKRLPTKMWLRTLYRAKGLRKKLATLEKRIAYCKEQREYRSKVTVWDLLKRPPF